MTIKQKIINELKRFYLYTFFLFILFDVFNLYERLLLGHDAESNIRYGYSLIEALVLAKIIILGDAFAIGEKFKQWPLIIHVIYKTLSFTLLLFCFEVFERWVIGWFSGRSFMQTYELLTAGKVNIILARSLIMMVIFAQFFTILEISRALGDNQLFSLFFKKRVSTHDNFI